MHDSHAASTRRPRTMSAPIDPRDILPPAEADRLVDAMALILLGAAKTRAARAAIARPAPGPPRRPPTT